MSREESKKLQINLKLVQLCNVSRLGQVFSQKETKNFNREIEVGVMCIDDDSVLNIIHRGTGYSVAKFVTSETPGHTWILITEF